MKPIDKTKKSNRRCANCKHWPDYYHDCPILRKRRAYYHCCPYFEWDTRKQYVQDGGTA